MSKIVGIEAREYASQGNAILGIRDSGKSYSATYIAEQLYKAGIPFIAFDPIGVWRFLRVPAKGPGLPVVVAGENGDIPLTPNSAADIVRSAMHENVSLVIDLYSMSMSKQDWRKIVETSIRLLLYENKNHGLRHVFLEEAAEFVPQRVGPDQGRVYAEIEKLARMGGNAMLGYTLINQRGEEVNKAVLELCDCLFLHRQKGRNSLTALGKWLDFADPDSSKEIIKSLPMLPQGECWIWRAGSDKPVHQKMPEKQTYHPDRRKTVSKEKLVATDVTGFVDRMKVELAKAKVDVDASDPKKLTARIHALEKELAKVRLEKPHTETKTVEVSVLTKEDRELLEVVKGAFGHLQTDIARNAEAFTENWGAPIKDLLTRTLAATQTKPAITQASNTIPRELTVYRRTIQIRDNAADSTLTGPEQRILNALAWLETIGNTEPEQTAVAFLAGYTIGGGAWNNPRGALRTKGLIDYRGDRLVLTDEGRSKAMAPTSPLTAEELQRMVLDRLPGPESKLLTVLIEAYPHPISNEDLAERSGYQAGGGAFNNPKGRLRSLGLIDYPGRGQVIARPLLFLQ